MTLSHPFRSCLPHTSLRVVHHQPTGTIPRSNTTTNCAVRDGASILPSIQPLKSPSKATSSPGDSEAQHYRSDLIGTIRSAMQRNHWLVVPRADSAHREPIMSTTPPPHWPGKALQGLRPRTARKQCRKCRTQAYESGVRQLTTRALNVRALGSKIPLHIANAQWKD